MLQLTCTDSSLYCLEQRVSFWVSIWNSLLTSATVTSLVDVATEALTTAKSVVNCTALQVPKFFETEWEQVIDASKECGAGVQCEVAQLTTTVPLPANHWLSCVRSFTDSPRPRLTIPDINAADRIFRAKHDLATNYIIRYSKELNCVGISIDLTTGASVADGDVISESLCLPFFGDIVLGECTSVPKLKLGLFTGVDCSMVPPTDGTMCSAWDIALTNEESDANCKLEKHEVAVRCQEMQQVPVTLAL